MNLQLKDRDEVPNNMHEISMDGTASPFISLEKVRDDMYYGRLRSPPTEGTYDLQITARDPGGHNREQKITVNVRVLACFCLFF